MKNIDGLYGAPFITSIHLLTEATFEKTDVTLVDKSNFCRTKVLLSAEVLFVCYRWRDRSPSVTSSNSFCQGKSYFCQTKVLLSTKVLYMISIIT